MIEPSLSRLYPVIPANARVITERDIQVGGYLIPKNVSVSRESVHLSYMAQSHQTEDECYVNASPPDSDYPVPLRNITGPRSVHAPG